MIIKRLFSTYRLALLLALFFVCDAHAQDASQHPAELGNGGAQAEFEWFEYAGHDGVFENVLTAGQYRNPVLAGFYPDPSVVRVGEDFYLVNSTFGYFPGIPIFHSRDLVNWRQIGNVIDRPDMLDFDGLLLSRQGVFAPTITYLDGLFYVANTCVACGGNFVVTAANPKGPWSDPIWLPEVGGIDPSLFFDDGRVYVVNNDESEGPALYDGHRAIWIREVDPLTLRSITKQKVLVDGGVKIEEKPVWIEGPHLYKVNGSYYLSAAEGGTEMDHRQVIFRSDDILGPYVPYQNNPVLTQRNLPDDRPNPVTSTGHADLVTDTDGNWWAVFLGTRNYDKVHFNTGRETFLLPVTWQDGWPVILEPGAVVPFVVTQPGVSLQPDLKRPVTGNFIIREEFYGDLQNYWMFLRAPGSQWWETGDGKLTITARNERIGDTQQPSIITRRVQHMNMQATTAMRFAAQTDSDEAGLVILQNDAYYLAFGISRNNLGETVLRLRQRLGVDAPARGVVVQEMPLEIDAGSLVYLRIEVRGPVVDFSWSADGEIFTPVATDIDARTLSTVLAGGFVGATVGMYAEQD